MTPSPDRRRYLFGHLMTCRNCVVESLIFCSEVAAQGRDYRNQAKADQELHAEFVDLVIKGRLRRIP
jgi:hypothetical protein